MASRLKKRYRCHVPPTQGDYAPALIYASGDSYTVSKFKPPDEPSKIDMAVYSSDTNRPGTSSEARDFSANQESFLDNMFTTFEDMSRHRDRPLLNIPSESINIESMMKLLPKAMVYLPCIKGGQCHNFHDTGRIRKRKNNLKKMRVPRIDSNINAGTSAGRMEPSPLLLNILPISRELGHIMPGGHCANKFCYFCGPGISTIARSKIVTCIDFSLEGYDVFKIRWEKLKGTLLDAIRENLWEYSLAPKNTFLKLFESALCSISVDELHKTVIDKCFLSGERLLFFYYTIESALENKISLIHLAPRLRFTVMVQVMIKFITFVFEKKSTFSFRAAIDRAVGRLKLPNFSVVEKSIMSGSIAKHLRPLLEDLAYESAQVCDGMDEKALRSYSCTQHNLCLSNCSSSKCQKKYTGIDKSTNGTWGLFALESILKDELIESLCGIVRTGDIGSDYTISFDKIFLDLRSASSLGRLVNHSCVPNSKLIKGMSGGTPAIFIQATRDIRCFEEITINYRTDLWFQCNCGYPQCVRNKCKRN